MNGKARVEGVGEIDMDLPSCFHGLEYEMGRVFSMADLAVVSDCRMSARRCLSGCRLRLLLKKSRSLEVIASRPR